MKGLAQNKVCSHLSQQGTYKHTNKEIRRSQARIVQTFKELVKAVAFISYYNPEYAIFFRGQKKDYKIKTGASSAYPALYRSPGNILTGKELQRRFGLLREGELKLVEAFKKQGYASHAKLSKFREVSWAILQHYDVCATPLLDITHSLRVAASFALTGCNEHGLVMVFGFPHVNGSISYYVEDELLNVRLLSICPPEAQRPYFQEGYLVGTFPARDDKKHSKLDVAQRLIAKFQIPNHGFWSDEFPAIPADALSPLDDEVARICKRIKQEIEATYSKRGNRKDTGSNL